MDEWYCRMGGQDYGPMPFQQLFQATAAGQVPADAWVRCGGQEWIPITAMPQLAAYFHRAPVSGGGTTRVVRKSSAASSGQVNIPPRDTAQGHATATQPIPAPVPSGLPVGAAVSPMGSVAPVILPGAPPVGNFVPQPGVAVPPPVTRAPIPAGVAVSGGPGIQVAAGKTKTAGKKTSAKVAPPPPGSHDDEGHGKKKKKGNPLMPVYVLGGTALGLLLVMVVVFIGMAAGGKKKKPVEPDEDVVATMEATTRKNLEINPAGEANPVEANPAEASPAVAETNPAETPKPTVVATNTKAPTTPVKGTASPAKKELALFEKQRSWRDPRRVTSLSGKRLKLEFVQAWLATNAAGTKVILDQPAGDAPVEPATDVPAAEPAATSPVSIPAASSHKPSYVFVQFKITNPAAQPLSYNSWNGPSKDTLPLLASDGTELVPFVPAAETAGVVRKTGNMTLAPQQSVVETLVFAAPPEQYTKLQLLLPQTALPVLGEGYLGWELHQEYFAAVASGATTTPVPPQVAAPMTEPGTPTEKPGEEMPAKPTVNNGDQPASVDDLKKSLEGPPMPMPKPGPPSIKDLDKQFQEMEKKPEAAPGAAPAAKPQP